ncbi:MULTISPECIES: hypothetical protein [Nocardiopsis]|uniref:Uncharacterized protein n=1 Tax=Nocardiopsis sinuspersici TaxID=501010 RepID=A0A1V3C716_9ACTN|nr:MULTISPECIES: hypothetical protein [Nocardiopsis]NYH53216.1 hypothetical protein [Nocardiopsis sinuspersici]OOC56574.1 hypothetical protein NOSIN_24365 [Nocardiopsis sinuspersici]
MVLAGREWLFSSRAVRVSRSAYTRLLLLSGIVAVAWLAGGFGVAHGETALDPEGLVDHVLEVGEGAEGAGQAAAQEMREARLSDATARAASTTESLTDTVVPQAAALPAGALHETGVSSALGETRTGTAANRMVEDTTQAVDGTARGAGDLVGGLARRGHDVVESTDESLRDSRLVGTVTEGLADSTRVVHGRIDDAVNTTAPLGLPVLGASDELTRMPAEAADKRTADTGDRVEERGRTASGAAVHTPVDPAVWHSAAAEAVDQVPDEDSGERIHLIAGGAHHPAGTTDATGAAAPSFPVPAAAGFLMARADHLAPRAQRVALPGDPTLVVRDAADDPTFSPD